MKYHGFISYSHADGSTAKWLHRRLEAYRLPRYLEGRVTTRGVVPARLRPIFRDREELPTSADLGSQIRSALEDSRVLIVVCSPRAAASRWVNEEILAFKRLGRSDGILCLICDGEPNAADRPGRETEECFHPALRYTVDSEGNMTTLPAEPIAADLRAVGDGRRAAFLKPVAGLTGVGFDELRRRDLQRQVRRARTVAVTAAVLVVTMAGLAVAALLARREAVLQQAVAERERTRAEHNFRDAREAVDRFYRKVAEESLLKAEGLQPLRRELLEEALDYYERFVRQREKDVAFAHETAIVRGHVGSILAEVGDPAAALGVAELATSELERLQLAAPDDGLIRASLSESLGNEAVCLFRLDRGDEALDHQMRAIDVYEPLRGGPRWDPGEWRRMVTVRGAFEAGLGLYEEAARSYEKAIAALCARAVPQMAPLGVDLEPHDNGMVVTRVVAGSPAEAAGLEVGDLVVAVAGIGCRVAADLTGIRERLEPGRPVDVRIRRSGKDSMLAVTPVARGNFLTAAATYNLGTLLLSRMGQPERVRPWLEQAADEYRRALLGDTVANPDVRDGLCYACAALARCGFHLEDGELYERATREAARVAEENARLNPAVPTYQATAGLNLTNLSSLLSREGWLREAAEACEAAIVHSEWRLRQVATNRATASSWSRRSAILH